MTGSATSHEMVLVTGATGFVGANLVAALNERGYPVRALHRRTSSLVALDGLVYEDAFGDILEPESLRAAMTGCKWVFHTAAVADYWRQGVEKLYRVNVQGTRNVVEAARAAGVERLVFTSSLAALGIPAPGQLLTEGHTFNLPPDRFPYGHSKHLAEQEIRKAAERGLQAIVVNPTIILGPRDVNFISGSIILKIARREVPPIFPIGGSNVVAISDVAAGHILAAERGRSGERYILGGENLSHAELARLVGEVVGVRIRGLPLPGAAVPVLAAGADLVQSVFGPVLPIGGEQIRLSTETFYADSSKARRELGLPFTLVRLAIEQAYRWYRSKGML